MSDFALSPAARDVLSRLDSAGLRHRFLHYFAQLASIPRGSGNTRAVSSYCVQFAREHGLRCVQDPLDNVVIYQGGTPGYEDHPPVILQGHLDMVCVQTPESRLDLEREPLLLNTDGAFLWADGTSLGADDGIAVAYALAVLEAEGLPHPPLEAVFTTEEETGMSGAHGLDPALLRGRVLLNLDSENEGLFFAGCSGGSKRTVALPVVREAQDGLLAELEVGGLLGGHSGIMIADGRANACQVLFDLLAQLAVPCGLRLVSCSGGGKDNAIPSSARARVLLPPEHLEQARRIVRVFRSELHSSAMLQRYGKNNPDLAVTFTPAEEVRGCSALDSSSTSRFISLFRRLPCGLLAMMRDIPGVPETSANIGVVELEESRAVIRLSVRSALKEKCASLPRQVEETAARFGASCQVSGAYPPWEYRKDSPLRETVCRVYRQAAGREAEIRVIHAGLECGILYEKLPGLDAVSFGPTILDIHSPGERLDLASALRTWEFLTALLAAL